MEKVAIKNKVKSFEKKIDDQYTFKVHTFNKTYYYLSGGTSKEGEFSISSLGLITKWHDIARWLTSDKVNKYLQERIKFYNEKDSLFE